MLCSFTHKGTYHVVNQQVNRNFFAHHLRTFAAKHVHFHSGFDRNMHQLSYQEGSDLRKPLHRIRESL